MEFLTRQRILTLQLARHFTAEIIMALDYLRQKQVVHRDLKPGNVVLDKDLHVKLIDFATCKLFNEKLAATAETSMKMMKIKPGNSMPEDDRNYSLVGTEDYIAPETIMNTSVSYSTDLWSLGVILYQLLTGKVPFINQLGITRVEIQPFPPNFDELAKNLIINLLRFDPTQRIGAHNLNDLKGHPFFQGVIWESLREIRVPFTEKKKKFGDVQKYQSQLDLL